ncbi:MAG: endolytic transglycosylase MltG [Mangrovibacterium sp.]
MKFGKYILGGFLLVLLVGGGLGYKLYRNVFSPNVKDDFALYISTEMTYEMLLDSMAQHDALRDIKSFDRVARYKKYPLRMKAGKYAFQKNQNTNALVNMLLAGNQIPVELTFNNLRFMPDLAAKVSDDLAPDSLAFISCLMDSAVWHKYGFNQHTFHAMFIPNTYQMYYASSPEQFVARMNKEYKRFWNASRLEKAASLGLTPVEVITLASIVQEETIKSDEKPLVAGLYLNRLRKNMRLQADPTVKYAVGDFSLQRVLNKHLQVDSPYNTYLYAGLPPGPINFPEISSIDAVLHASKHKYIYMCAKEDFSGYHNFAQTLREHNNNARKYRQALNQRRIYR